MDDGAFDGKQIRLNTQSFSLQENEGLSNFLRAKLGIEALINRDKDHHRLRISSASLGKFKSLVRPHIIPSMLYKLPL
jgi:hypothetical protein